MKLTSAKETHAKKKLFILRYFSRDLQIQESNFTF